MKLTSMEGKRKKPCPYCGAESACPDWTCKKIKAIVIEDGYQQVEYFTPADMEGPGPREIHLHFHGMGAEEVAALTERFDKEH